MATIPEIRHKINERVTLIQQAQGTMSLKIRRVDDNFYFNRLTTDFEPYNSGNEASYVIAMPELYDTGLASVNLLTLPRTVQDLLFEFTDVISVVDEPDVTVVTLERHVFGGFPSVDEPTLCTVLGTLKDVSGKPLVGQKIEAYLNRAGFFTHKAGLIGYAATALTDELGYFELPLVVGLDVTINVPIVGFTTRGFVPNVQSVELTSQTLLSYQPG